MALKKTVITNHGFDSVNAYHRVENINIKEKDKIDFCVRSYKNIGLPAFNDEVFQCSYNLNGNNPIKQAYEYLKKTEKFKDAIDC